MRTREQITALARHVHGAGGWLHEYTLAVLGGDHPHRAAWRREGRDEVVALGAGATPAAALQSLRWSLVAQLRDRITADIIALEAAARG